MIKRNYFKREFKLGIIQQIGSKSIAQIATENNIHPTTIYKWKQEHESNPKKAFAGHGKICKLEAEVANYQRLVGQLYAQIDFLKKASESLKVKISEEKIKRR